MDTIRDSVAQVQDGLAKEILVNGPPDLQRDFSVKKHMGTMGLDMVNRASGRKGLA